MVRSSAILCFAAVAVLSACGRADLSTNGDLSTGPDEFSVVPNRALEQPPSYTSLPEPTPGAANRADIDPDADAILALGGRPGASAVGVDTALLAHVRRNGVDPEIRDILARSSGRRLFGGAMTLDAYAELERLRALGVRVPTAPPR